MEAECIDVGQLHQGLLNLAREVVVAFVARNMRGRSQGSPTYQVPRPRMRRLRRGLQPIRPTRKSSPSVTQSPHSVADSAFGVQSPRARHQPRAYLGRPQCSGSHTNQQPKLHRSLH
jgi:hypothetical protein